MHAWMDILHSIRQPYWLHESIGGSIFRTIFILVMYWLSTMPKHCQYGFDTTLACFCESWFPRLLIPFSQWTIKSPRWHISFHTRNSYQTIDWVTSLFFGRSYYCSILCKPNKMFFAIGNHWFHRLTNISWLLMWH